MNHLLLYIYFLGIVVSLTTAFTVHGETAHLENEILEHEFIDSPSLTRHSEDTIQLNTKAFGQDYSLNLKRSTNIFDEDFKLMSLETGDDKQYKLKHLHRNVPSTDIFTDEVHGSVLHISDNNGTLTAEGLLTPELSIAPHSDDQHKVVRAEENYQQKKIRNSLLKSSTSFSTTRVTREMPDVANPEVLVIVDYKHAATMKFDTNKIMKYLAIFWNAVNRRYASFMEPKIQLSVVGAVIIKTPEQQPYMEKARFVSLRKVYIDFPEALLGLAQHLYSNPEKFPKYDVLMVMTGEDLAAKDEDDGTAEPSFTGIALVGGACQIDKENNITNDVGIAEDRPPFYSGVLHHAHEIAHMLGAVHDGDEPAEHLPGSPGAEACPFKDGYLMSYKLSSRNRMHWSQCTVDQIKWYLGTAEAECLFNRENAKVPMPLSNILPGTLVSIDQQCQYAGKNGKAYPTQDKATMCLVLYCISDKTGVTTAGPALEGTPCGYLGNRWCINGECVRQGD